MEILAMEMLQVLRSYSTRFAVGSYIPCHPHAWRRLCPPFYFIPPVPSNVYPSSDLTDDIFQAHF